MSKLTLLQQCAIQYYGEDFVDTLIPLKTTIRFPEFNLTNLRTGQTHLIKDLYVTLHEGRNNVLESITGFRGILSDKEWQDNYRHSHLHNVSQNNERIRDNNTFCLGQSDVNGLKGASYSTLFTEHDWTLFMLTLENYVQCESEGPFRFFRNIGDHSNNYYSVGDNDVKKCLDDYKRLLKDCTYELSIELTGNNSNPVNVVISDEFLRSLVPFLHKNHVGTYDDNKGYAVKLSISRIVSFSGETQQTFLWKGQERKVVVYSTASQDPSEVLDFPRKEFVDKLTQYINIKVNEEFNNNYSRRQEYTSTFEEQAFITDIIST